MPTRLHRRRTALVKADAAALIKGSGGEAYFKALDCDRAERRGTHVDANRPACHWSDVKVRIAALSAKEIGLDTETSYRPMCRWPDRPLSCGELSPPVKSQPDPGGSALCALA